MSKLYCFNVGKADCFLLELTCGEKTEYVLVDGGSRAQTSTYILSCLQNLGIKRLSCMILTHLHQDHLGYLDNIAKEIQVDKAVLPYPPIPLTQRDLDGIQDSERIEDILAYNRLWNVLRERQCQIETTLPLTASSCVFGDFELRCLYPFPETVSYVYAMLCRLQGEKPDKIKLMYDSIRTFFNKDSSLWLLKKNQQPLLLLCGDGVHSALAAAVGGYGIKVPIIKLAHHGRNDKGNLYFQDTFMDDLEPEKIIITSDMVSAQPFLEGWLKIRPEAELIITGMYKEVRTVEL